MMIIYCSIIMNVTFYIYTSFVFYTCETFIKSLNQFHVSGLHCPHVSYLFAFHVSFCPNRYIKAEGRALIKTLKYRFNALYRSCWKITLFLFPACYFVSLSTCQGHAQGNREISKLLVILLMQNCVICFWCVMCVTINIVYMSCTIFLLSLFFLFM